MLTVIDTKPGLWTRARLCVRAAYIRMKLRSVEADIEHHVLTAELTPRLIRIAEQYRDELRVQLIDCELGGRAK